MSDDDRPMLAFSIKYLENGDATLTVAGPAQAIREAAAAVFPDTAAALNPPLAEPLSTCAACGDEFRLDPTAPMPSITRCPECVRQQFTPLEPVQHTLSASALDAMTQGSRVYAMSYPCNDERLPRLTWVKVYRGNWSCYDGPTMSSKWLAANGAPRLDD